MLFEDIIGSSKDDLIHEEFKDTSLLEEVMIADEVAHLPQDKIQEFCQAGGVGEQLVQEGKLRRKTLVRLNKTDDLTRRTKMGALLLAKEHNDPLYAKLVKNRQQKRDLVDKIMRKYGNKGKTVAKKAQAEYLHGKSSALPKNFQKFGGADRVGE